MGFDRVWMDRWVGAINGDAQCRHAGRFFTASFSLVAGEKRFTFHVERGGVRALIEDGGPLEPSQFTLTAPASVWENLWSPRPAPMAHDVFAAIGSGQMQIEGDVGPVFRHMAPLSAWFTAARGLRGGQEIAPDPEWTGEFQATGRYVPVEIGGTRNKVFYFEAGEGIPVLCQHTAGAENRQWHYLLEDRDLTKRYRFIAYDLPSHGKSDPPLGGPGFWEADHLLTSDWITGFVTAFADALDLERPIFMGCSIGGVIALHLAARYPERFRGFIAMAGAIPTYGFFHDWWIDPSVNMGLTSSGTVDSVIAPTVSRRDRDLNRLFQSANPRALRNDLHLWGAENADETRAERIDAGAVPVHLMAGEYDFTCPPALIEATAKRIGSEARYHFLEGLGHFPMAENYALFRPYLLDALREITERN